MRHFNLTVGISTTLVASAVAGLALNAGFAMAQSNASSTIEATSTTEAIEPAATSTLPDLSAPTSQPSVVTEAPLKLARTIGTRYVDYCTDGTKTVKLPGDPAIDANLSQAGALTPKCPDGMTWDHTSGMDAYDTPSGELEVGSYAQLADGSYIVRYPAGTYTDATSTASWPERSVVTKTAPITQEPAPAANGLATEAPLPSPTDASSTTATSTQ